MELMSDLVGSGFGRREGGPTSSGQVLPRSIPSATDVSVAVRLARFYTEYHLERRLKSAATAEAMARH